LNNQNDIPSRSLDVLRAIVNDYIETSEPVGSKTLVERHGFEVSAATIRNEMAFLEEEQLIAAPHTSSGRVPTDKGYRLFVDRLSEVKRLSASERLAIETFMSSSADLDEVLSGAVQSLAQLTNQVAMVQYPSLGRAKIKAIELVPINETRTLVVLVSDNDRVQQHMVNAHQVLSIEDVAELRARFNAALVQQPFGSAVMKLETIVANSSNHLKAAASVVAEAVQIMVDANRQEKIILAGTANLARHGQAPVANLGDLLDALEQQVVMMRLIAEMKTDQEGLGLLIGKENNIELLSQTSVLVSSYEKPGSEIAKVGVLGPTRMDYAHHISAVRAVANYLTKTLGA
jgi:heat-inducible transcriptional repressor